MISTDIKLWLVLVFALGDDDWDLEDRSTVTSSGRAKLPRPVAGAFSMNSVARAN
jgi:hypothetical protein